MNSPLKQAADVIYTTIRDTLESMDGRSLLFDHYYGQTRKRKRNNTEAHDNNKNNEASVAPEVPKEEGRPVVAKTRHLSSSSSNSSSVKTATTSNRNNTTTHHANSNNSNADDSSEEEDFCDADTTQACAEPERKRHKSESLPIHYYHHQQQQQQQQQEEGATAELQLATTTTAATTTGSNANAFSTEETDIFPIATLVRKHFPSKGWYDGQVTKVRWSKSRGRWLYKIEYEKDKRDDNDKKGEENEEDSTTTTADDDDDDIIVDTETLTFRELQEIVLPKGRYVDPTVYTFDEFADMWEILAPETIEKSSAVRRANTRISNEDSGTQHTAQYGRILPRATDILFHVLRLKRSDVFLDIGHGVGNACLQAAYCTGCEARGIEIIKDRYQVSLDFSDQLGEIARQRSEVTAAKTGRSSQVPGDVILRRGDLSDGLLHNWLVKANKVFVNNFGGVFAERCVNNGSKWHLDHYIAGLLASMEEETIIITLSDLQMGPTRREVNKWRIANKMETTPNASFFDVVKVNLGEASQVFSWSQSSTAPAFAYVYRRLKQDPNLRTASVTCCNRDCRHSRLGTAIPAVTYNKEGKAVVGACSCKRTSLRSRRDIPVVTFLEFLNPNGDYNDWGL